MPIVNMKISGVTEPMGYDFGKPILSWQVVGGAGTQKDAAIKVYTDDAAAPVWECRGDLNWEGTVLALDALLPRTLYTVAVEVTDSEGTLHTGETWFETGLMDEPWQAKWLSCEAEAWAPTFCGSFAAEKVVAKARLYMAGLGVYTAQLNGKKVGEEFLAPGFWYFEKEAPYQTYDVTALLSKENTLEVTLGNGWYKGRFGIEHTPYSDQYALLAQLHVTYEDGTEQVFCTDETWTWKNSDIRGDNNLYDGEVLDRLAHEEEENEPCAVTVIPAPLAIVPRLNPPVVEALTLPVVEVLHTPAGETVLDFGQNHAGLLRFKADLPRGTEVRFEFGEVLQQGNFYNENYRSALGGFTYRSNGKAETVCQEFTFYGFRYVRVTGWVGEVKAEDFESPVLHTVLDRTGYLTTGNKLVNRLYENVLWGQRSNFLSMPTDCPQRDERLGWTGDAQVFSPTACYNMDCRAFYRSFLRLLRLDQIDHEGSVATCLPRSPGFLSCAIWSDASAIIPETLLRFSGSSEEVAEYYDLMRDWVDYAAKLCHNYLYDEDQLGDWLALDGVTSQSFKGGTDDTYLGSVYLMNSARIVSEFAALLGKTEDAAKYAELSANIRAAVMDTFFTPAGRLSVDTQAAYITALKFGLWRDKDVLIQQFLRRMRFDGFEIRCGFAGAPLMCSVLAEHGLDDLACELLLHRGFPGWMYCVELGATTVWERWNSLLPDGTCSGTGMNSFNHYAYGSVMEYVYGYVAGIRPSKAGFRHATIAPLPNIRLGHVACTLDTVSGKYVSNWNIAENGDVTIHIEVPFGCSAEVTLPRSGKAPFTVESGCYDYTYTPTEDYRALYSMDSRLAALADDEEAKQILLQETPALFGILMENNREFTTQTFHELSTAFFLGLNPPKIQALMARLSALRYRPDQH